MSANLSIFATQPYPIRSVCPISSGASVDYFDKVFTCRPNSPHNRLRNMATVYGLLHQTASEAIMPIAANQHPLAPASPSWLFFR
jgi:hypothetical protein